MSERKTLEEVVAEAAPLLLAMVREYEQKLAADAEPVEDAA